MHDHDDLVDAWRDLAARSRQRRDAEAEDHLQDAVVAALDERRRTGRSPDVAAAWLRTVARRREVDHVRRAQCERRVVAESASFADPAAYDVDGEVLDRHEARWLAGHVDQLPETTRTVVRALASGATQVDVATQLGLSPRAVEGHVRRARLSLRRALERAGAAVGILLTGRRWRRVTSVAVAGATAAIGVSLIGTGDTHGLIPIPTPRPPHVVTSHHPKTATAPYLAAAGLPPAGPAALPAPAPRPAAGRVQDASPHARPTDDPPANDPAGNQVVLVSAKGGEQPTEFPTDRGAWYEITAAGTYSYNGRATGLADCGHWVPEYSPDWTRYDALVVDGAPSPCSTMPVDALHQYRWRQQGTGRPMTFRIQDDGGSRDNLGSIVVTIRRVDAPLAMLRS